MVPHDRLGAASAPASTGVRALPGQRVFAVGCFGARSWLHLVAAAAAPTSIVLAVMLLSFCSTAVITTRVPALISSTLIIGLAFTFVSFVTLTVHGGQQCDVHDDGLWRHSFCLR